MKLSTKGRYAVTAMLDLALNANQGRRVTLADISEFQGISLSYLEQLFARLRSAKLVQGTRGPGGGYRLARPAAEITIAEIITSVDDNARKVKKVATDHQHSKTQELWNELSQDIYGYLGKITLGSLIDRDKAASQNEAAKPESEAWTIEDAGTVRHRTTL